VGLADFFSDLAAARDAGLCRKGLDLLDVTWPICTLRVEAGLVFRFGGYLLGDLILLLNTVLDGRIYEPLRIDRLVQITKRLLKDTDQSAHGNASLPHRICCLAPMPTRPPCRRNE